VEALHGAPRQSLASARHQISHRAAGRTQSGAEYLVGIHDGAHRFALANDLRAQSMLELKRFFALLRRVKLLNAGTYGDAHQFILIFVYIVEATA
jgi:hypothetical protein